MKLAQAIAEFCRYLEGERRASVHTVAAYGRDLTQLVVFLDHKLQRPAELHDVSKLLLRSWLGELARTLKSESIARKLAAAKSLFRFLQRRDYVQVNPTAQLVAPKLARELPMFLGVDAASEVMTAPANAAISEPQCLRDSLMLELLYGCGLRVNELCSLSVGSIDQRLGELRVTGKGDKERVVPVGAVALAALRAYLPRRKELLLPKRTAASDALLINRYGSRLSVRSVQKLVQRYGATGAGRADLHPHALRHSCATHMLEGGADLRAIQEFLGHASLSTTQRYTHVSFEQLLRVYDAAHPLASRSAEVAEDGNK